MSVQRFEREREREIDSCPKRLDLIRESSDDGGSGSGSGSGGREYTYL